MTIGKSKRKYELDVEVWRYPFLSKEDSNLILMEQSEKNVAWNWKTGSIFWVTVCNLSDAELNKLNEVSKKKWSVWNKKKEKEGVAMLHVFKKIIYCF